MSKVYDNIKVSVTLDPEERTASENGSTVDTQGYHDAMAVLEVGAVSGTSPTLDVKLQESDDDSTWSDVSGYTFTQVTATDSSQVLRIENLNTTRSRYLRLVATIAGTSPSFDSCAVILLGEPESGPVNS